MHPRARSVRLAFLATTAAAIFAGACSSSSSGGGVTTPDQRGQGQSSFVSAPMPGQSKGTSFGAGGSSSSGGAASADAGAAPANAGTSTGTRTVEETDLYRLEGDRLYYLNAYRGLMVFDVSNVDSPKLLGRAPIYGSPVEMLVRGGVATVVVADWYGALADGSPFHGSIVRGFDATDPTNIRALGDAKLGGWVRDLRVVGDVLYAVSEQYDETYGWGAGGAVVPVAGAGGGGYYGSGSHTVVSSVSFAGGKISAIGQVTYDGWGGVFNVTPSSILLAHDGPAAGQYGVATSTDLQYLDISDPGGKIVVRGSIEVHGRAQGWGADNGRWNLDFADGKTAHVVGCAGGDYGWCGGQQGSYVLATADFTSPDAPVVRSELAIPSTGWSIAARFDGTRMYLVPGDSYYYGGTSGDGGVPGTPFQVYDLSDPAAPKLTGSAQIPGNVWMMIPSGNRLFALGNDYTSQSGNVSLKYLDVTDPASPKLLGTSAFGQGWAWTPAADTFKAFTKDDTQGLVVLPFSGWSSQYGQYNDGTQLIEFTPTTIRTAGAAKTRGWVERGIFVKNRIVALSDLSLSVVDYANHDAPRVVTELTLARNVVAAQPQGATVAQISSDWWGNDTSHSEVRVLPLANAEESRDEPAALTLNIDGVAARVFRNGDLAYVVTNVSSPAACPGGSGYGGCTQWQEKVQVVDLSNDGARLRGSVALPVVDGYGYGYGGYYGGYFYGGYYGYYWNDWYDGAEAVQVGADVLAFRRWQPVYDGTGGYVDARQSLFVVDLSSADAPKIASTVVTEDFDAWWGNLTVVGSTLYASHYEWLPDTDKARGQVRYFLDRIDLSDRAHPRIGAKINVPGILVGGSEVDPSLLYVIDYRWYDATENQPRNDFDVVRVEGSTAFLESATPLSGWVGNVYVRGSTAWASAEQYTWDTATAPTVQLHQIDLSNPTRPIDRVATTAGWGWLLGVEGDRAVLSSGWGSQGIDIYRLSPTAAPTFDQFVRTRGWSVASLARQGNQLFLSSGYWGVQVVGLN
jgi:hypothetical protein